MPQVDHHEDEAPDDDIAGLLDEDDTRPMRTFTRQEPPRLRSLKRRGDDDGRND